MSISAVWKAEGGEVRPWPRSLVVAGLGVVLVMNVALGYAWMERNGFLVRPLPDELASSRGHAVEFLVAAERGPSAVMRWLNEYRWHHGPVLAVSAGIVGLLGGDRVVGPVSTWITTCPLFGTLLLIGTMRLATGIGLRPRAALAATALCAVTPIIVCANRSFAHQMPMAALVTLAMGEMVRTAGFTKLAPSLRTGLFIGLAGLAKNIAPIYLAGPALAELIFGRRKGAGRRAVLGSAAALAVAVALVLPWLLASRQEIVDYSRWGIAFASAAGAWWSPVRWLYAPRACANSGFGLIPTLVLLGLALARGGRARGGADLRVPMAQIALSYPVLALYQPVGESGFLVSWMPVLSIAAVELARRVVETAPRIGRAAVGLLVAGALVNVALMQRGIYEDRVGFSTWGVEIPPKCDWYLVEKVSGLGVIASSDPERWPMAEFADAILSRPLGHTPVVLGTHTFLEGNNLRCLALAAGGDIRPRPLVLATWKLDVMASDYFVIDDLGTSLPEVLSLLASNGIRTEVVLRLPVIGERAVTLVRVLR